MKEVTADKPENQTDKEEVVKNSLPSIEDFKKLSLDQQEQLLKANENLEVQEEEESDKSEEVSDEKKEEEASKKDETTPDPESDKQEVDVKKELETLKKNYKELQGAFTKSRQELSEIKKTQDASKSQADPADKVSENISKLAQLAKGDANAEKFMSTLEEAIKEEVEKRVSAQVKPLEQQATERITAENLAKFNKEASEFLSGPLSGLQNDLNEILAERYASNEEMIDAAKRNPNLFTEVRRELKDRHTDKIVDILAKSKSKEQDPEARKKEVDATGVSKKSKTSKTESTPDADDIEKFKKLPLAEQEKHLKSKGLME